MVAVHYWPPSIDFDAADLATVVDVLNTQARERERANARRR